MHIDIRQRYNSAQPVPESQNHRSDGNGCSARQSSSARQQQPSRQTRAPRPARPARRSRAPGGPGRRRTRLRPRRSSLRTALRNRPGGGGGTVPPPGRSLRDERPQPLHLLPFVPIPAPGRPRTRRPEGAPAQLRDPHRRDREKPGAGRSPDSRPAPTPLFTRPETGSAALLLAPTRPGPRPPLTAALSRARDGGELSARPPGPHRPPHPRPATAAASPGCRPGGPQGSGRPGPGLAQSGGGAGTGREPGAPSGPSPSLGHRARQPPVPESPGTGHPSRCGPAGATYRGLRETGTERQRPDGGEARN